MITQPDMLTLELDLWQDLIRQRCGLHFSESRLRFLRQSLWERMCAHDMRSYQEYYEYVTVHPDGRREWKALLDLLLNHETGFFRHLPSFEALRGHVLPGLLRDDHREETITMWSAGCSMGQEPYSLAMAFLEHTTACFLPRGLRGARETSLPWRVKVTGSDISPRALEKARHGRYKPHEIRTLPAQYRQQYFTELSEGHNLLYQVIPQVQALVDFTYVNLHDLGSFPPFPLPGKRSGGFDVIFCQNVLIYFQREQRVAVVERLCQYLRPGGYLFLGPAEVVGLQLPGVRAVRIVDALIYQRIP